jgi:hypothetical protein
MKTKIKLGKSVSDKVNASVYYSAINPIYDSLYESVYDSVWSLVNDSISVPVRLLTTRILR